MEKKKQRKPWVNWMLFFASIVIVFLLGLLASSIMERRAEAVFAYKPVVDIEMDYEPRNELWGKNYPREFESYYRTADTTFQTKYNGGVMIDMLEVDPRLVVLWAGYGFSKDYNQGRGHFYAVADIRNTLRTGGPKTANDGPMPNTCWTCKGPDVPRLMKEHGIAEFYKGKWASKGSQIVNSIGCADCHDPQTMELRISRPALIEAFERQGKDIKKSTHQEMRSLVCAQCHVEYYFNKKKPVEGVPYLTLPWDKGTTPEAMLEYYNNIDFADWTHSISKAKMLKAQHPGYEMYKTSIHYERGVSCADCHMPYVNEGGVKFSNHHMTSPLRHASQACQVCHRESESTLYKNTFDKQDRVIEVRDLAEIELVKAHVEAGKAWELGATETEMAPILDNIRTGQWFWDYAAASHGGSAHAPIETLRICGKALDAAKEARVQLVRLLAKYNFTDEVPYPDIQTKAKAQKFVGLPMEKLNKEKKVFLEEVVPLWEAEAQAREATYPEYKK
jgi:nitrite reductase (cytochrome c-552)